MPAIPTQSDDRPNSTAEMPSASMLFHPEKRSDDKAVCLVRERVGSNVVVVYSLVKCSDG